MSEALVVREPSDLTLETFEQVVFDRRPVALDAELLERLEATRGRLLARLGGGPVYGINTGMGYLSGVTLSEAEQAVHQRNLLLGRAVGGPPFFGRHEARAILLARLIGFLHGHAGVTPQLCTFLVDRLNDDFVPAIPREGAGSAGEIIPLSHAFQTFIGVGSVVLPSGGIQDAEAALLERHVPPYDPALKEGIALLAGAPGALGLAIVHRRTADVLVQQLLSAAACAIDAIRAPLSPYDARIARLANDPVMVRILARLAALLDGSEREPGKTQAPVSFRVIPQVFTHLERTVERLADDIRRALGASDDSPAFVNDEFMTSGNFHAIGLAAGMDAMALALVQAAELAGQHIHRLLDHRFSGLPDQLTARPGPQAGLIVVHKRVVGTINQLRRLAIPSSIGLMDTSLGQEDAMTFGFEAAEKLRRVETLVREIAACELLVAYQAWSLRMSPVARGLSRYREQLDSVVKPVDIDRPLGPDISKLIEILGRGAFAQQKPTVQDIYPT